MKRRHVLIIVMALAVLAGCMMPDANPTQKDPEIRWPFDGVTVQERTSPDVDAIPGSYRNWIDYSFESELVSFRDDGTLVSVPFDNLFSTAGFPRKEGTWSYDSERNTIRITVGGETMESKVLTLTDNGRKTGFGYIDSNNHQVKFKKVSDGYMDLKIYRGRTFEGLYAAKNDYEEVYGWEFRKDGTAIHHTKERDSFRYTYKTNPDRALIKLIDAMGWEDEYNYCLLDGYLYLNGKPYQKIR